MASLIKLTLNVDKEEKEAIEAYANARDDSMSKVVRRVMRHFLYERGLLPEDANPPEGDQW